jgi:hypothetical protein
MVSLILALSGCRTPAGPRAAPENPAPPPAKKHSLVAFGPDWPRITPGVESRYFSSFDRRGGNADGFAGRFATLYKLASGEHVIVDALGPGVLNTLWFTGPREGGEGLDLGALRFYFDDEERPRITTDVKRLFGGKQPPFARPLVADNKVSTGGFVSWVPLSYRRRLIVTTERKPAFCIAQYDTYPSGTPVETWRPGADLGGAARLFTEALRGPSRAPFTAVPLDHRHQGSGTVEAIRFEPAKKPTAEQLARARMKIYWDGEASPGVDAPLGMFFGSGLGEAKVRALAFSIDPGGPYENRLPMPFWRGFHIQVTGIEGRLGLRLGPERFAPREDTRLPARRSSVSGSAGHLHAVFSEAAPTRPGRDFEWLHREGTGKLVGTVLTIRPPTPETKKWWEGDLRSYVDGRRTPGLHGTGHEDDHLGGWSNTFLEGPFTLPMHGEPRTEMIEREGVQYNARITLYRLWPGLHFMGGIRHSVEHGTENSVQANYAGLTFFYLQPGPPRLAQTDRLDLGDAESRRRHGFRVAGEGHRVEKLASAFEGRGYRERVEDAVLTHEGAATFELVARPRNVGCFLRRMYDQRVPRQRAAVSVDGRPLADWYVAEGNETLRWAERDLFLPASVTSQKSRLRIEIRPRRPGWNAAEYRLLCVAP